MKTLYQLSQLLARISYKNWEFISGTLDSGFFLQVRFSADGQQWSGRKWYVSAHSTDSEIVQTALKAVLTAEEHEAREHFTVDGIAVYGPHFSLAQALELARSGNMQHDIRPQLLKKEEAS